MRRITGGKEWFGGICAGFAYYTESPLRAVRVITLLLILWAGFGFWVYLLLWVFMPKMEEVPDDFNKVVDNE